MRSAGVEWAAADLPSQLESVSGFGKHCLPEDDASFALALPDAELQDVTDLFGDIAEMPLDREGVDFLFL